MKRILIVLSATALFLSCSTPKQKTPTYYTPKGKVRIQTEIDKQDLLRTTGTTANDMKKYVSVDTGCPVEKITIISMVEELGNGIYNLDVCGTKMKYRRVGSVFYKDGENPSGM